MKVLQDRTTWCFTEVYWSQPDDRDGGIAGDAYDLYVGENEKLDEDETNDERV